MWECKTHQWILGVLLVAIVAFLPGWSYSGDWGYFFSGRIAVVLTVFIVLKIAKLI